MMADEKLREKRDAALDLVEQGVVMLHLDPRGGGVLIPPEYKRGPVLRLNVAWAFELPVFRVTNVDVLAVLSFRGVEYPCCIPWAAVYAMTLRDKDHDGMIWPSSMPPESDPFFAPPGGAAAWDRSSSGCVRVRNPGSGLAAVVSEPGLATITDLVAWVEARGSKGATNG